MLRSCLRARRCRLSVAGATGNNTRQELFLKNFLVHGQLSGPFNKRWGSSSAEEVRASTIGEAVLEPVRPYNGRPSDYKITQTDRYQQENFAENHEVCCIRPKLLPLAPGAAQNSSNWGLTASYHARSPTQAYSHQQFDIDLWWLRDHCVCDECVDPVTKQRNLNTFDRDMSHSIQGLSHVGDTSATAFQVKWSDGHQSEYGKAWLAKALNIDLAMDIRLAHDRPLWWGDAGFRDSLPAVEYSNMDKGGFEEWLSKIKRYGFCIVTGCPINPEATQKLLERIGPIRNTHYGGFYDFTADLASKDTAYTSVALDVHNDTTYFSDPVGLQMLHMLSHTDGSGGSTQLVDGFRVAQKLRHKEKAAYKALSKVKIMAHASGNDGVSIQPSRPFPVLSHRAGTGELYQVRWNNADRAGFLPTTLRADQGKGHITVKEWYEAARLWNDLLLENDGDSRLEFQLEPGSVLIFDNWRVLHGRSAFTGKRRMCGGYINRDDFISSYKIATKGREEVLENGIY